jgi:predicted permease
MPIKDAIDLLFAARERIDFYWNFYVVVVIAVVGWIITRKEPLTRPTRILVTVAYLIAAATNLVGLYGSYTFAEALRQDLLRMTAGSPLAETRLALAQHSYGTQRFWAFIVHFGVAATLLLVVWARRNTDRKDSSG